MLPWRYAGRRSFPSSSLGNWGIKELTSSRIRKATKWPSTKRKRVWFPCFNWAMGVGKCGQCNCTWRSSPPRGRHRTHNTQTALALQTARKISSPKGSKPVASIPKDRRPPPRELHPEVSFFSVPVGVRALKTKPWWVFSSFHTGQPAWGTLLIPRGGELAFSVGTQNTQAKPQIRAKPRLSSRFCLFCGAELAKNSPVRRPSTLNSDLGGRAGGRGGVEPQNLISFNGEEWGGGVNFSRPT